MRRVPGKNPIVERVPGLIEAEADGQLVGLHIGNGLCYGFNPTATRIWQLIATPLRFDDLCTVLADEFAVDPATCAADVRTMLAELAGEKLVVLRD